MVDILDAARYFVFLSYGRKQYSLTPLKLQKISTCAVAIWLGAAIKQQKYNSHILPSAL